MSGTKSAESRKAKTLGWRVRSLKWFSIPSMSGAVMAALLVTSSSGLAGLQMCEQPHCGPPSSPGGKKTVAEPEAVFRVASLADVIVGWPRSAHSRKGLSPLRGQTLFASLSGQWDTVSAFVTFPYSFESGTTDHLLVRGLLAQRLDSEGVYRVPGWTRSAYWIDAGDGIPKLLSSQLVDANYQPHPDDPFVDAGHLNLAQLVLYREQGRDYSDYQDGAAFASIVFVADPTTGEVIDAVVNLNDAQGNYEKTEYMYEGDQLLPLILTYRLSQPDAIYYAEYGDFINLTQALRIEPNHYIPGQDFTDPDVFSVGFDAAQAPLNLILEGYRSNADEWGFSAVHPLGYTWGEARHGLFDSGFEFGIRSGASAKSGAFVRQR